MPAALIFLTNFTTQFKVVFALFLVVMIGLVVLIIRWALRENRARRERFNAAVRSKDQD